MTFALSDICLGFHNISLDSDGKALERMRWHSRGIFSPSMSLLHRSCCASLGLLELTITGRTLRM